MQSIERHATLLDAAAKTAMPIARFARIELANGFAAMARTAKKVADAIKKALNADGVNIAMNNEPAAGQVVFYTHLHVIPRITGDGLKLWPQRPYEEGQANETAEKIKAALG